MAKRSPLKNHLLRIVLQIVQWICRYVFRAESVFLCVDLGTHRNLCRWADDYEGTLYMAKFVSKESFAILEDLDNKFKAHLLEQASLAKNESEA